MHSPSLPMRITRGGTLFLCRLITDLWLAHKQRAAYRRSLQDLRDLDETLLRDVGLTKADQRRGSPEDYY